MFFNHRVKRNGVYYEAGQDVPDIKDNSNDTQNTDIELPFSDTDIELEMPTVKRGRPPKKTN